MMRGSRVYIFVCLVAVFQVGLALEPIRCGSPFVVTSKKNGGKYLGQGIILTHSDQGDAKVPVLKGNVEEVTGNDQQFVFECSDLRDQEHAPVRYGDIVALKNLGSGLYVQSVPLDSDSKPVDKNDHGALDRVVFSAQNPTTSRLIVASPGDVTDKVFTGPLETGVSRFELHEYVIQDPTEKKNGKLPHPTRILTSPMGQGGNFRFEFAVTSTEDPLLKAMAIETKGRDPLEAEREKTAGEREIDTLKKEISQLKTQVQESKTRLDKLSSAPSSASASASGAAATTTAAPTTAAAAATTTAAAASGSSASANTLVSIAAELAHELVESEKLHMSLLAPRSNIAPAAAAVAAATTPRIVPAPAAAAATPRLAPAKVESRKKPAPVGATTMIADDDAVVSASTSTQDSVTVPPKEDVSNPFITATQVRTAVTQRSGPKISLSEDVDNAAKLASAPKAKAPAAKAPAAKAPAAKADEDIMSAEEEREENHAASKMSVADMEDDEDFGKMPAHAAQQTLALSTASTQKAAVKAAAKADASQKDSDLDYASDSELKKMVGELPPVIAIAPVHTKAVADADSDDSEDSESDAEDNDDDETATNAALSTASSQMQHEANEDHASTHDAMAHFSAEDNDDEEDNDDNDDWDSNMDLKARPKMGSMLRSGVAKTKSKKSRSANEDWDAMPY